MGKRAWGACNGGHLRSPSKQTVSLPRGRLDRKASTVPEPLQGSAIASPSRRDYRGQVIDVNFIADTDLQSSRSWTPIISVILSSHF
jgi:hypothetical protein